MLPAMLVIGVACLTTKILLKQDSMFVERLNFMGLESTIHPITKILRRSSIDAIATPIVTLPKCVTFEQVQDLQLNMVDYAVIELASTKLVRVSAIVGLLAELEFGPQKWLDATTDQLTINLDAALDGLTVRRILLPNSLEDMLDWFVINNVEQVLVENRQTTLLQLVERSKLEQFLLKGDR